MRVGAIAAGVVVVALAGSLGIIYAQNGEKSLLPWAKAGAETTGMVAGKAAPPPASSEAQELAAQTAAPVVVAQAGANGAASAPLKVAAQSNPPQSSPTPPPPSQPQLTPAEVMKGPPCTNPDGLGVSRVVEIDTTGGPGFGSGHFHQYDFLRPGEVVLTFDDGPWLHNTEAVLKALADQCVKATFFAIGKHATYYPEILRQVYAAGHTVGSHTWSHKDLSKKTPDEAKEEIEMGVSAVKMALGHPIAPFFRFPALRHPPEMVAYLGERNVGIFSMDTDSQDFKIRKPEKIIQHTMAGLKKQGKGILLLHDFQKGTSQAVPELLAELKAGGYKIVHMVPKGQLQSLAQYDEMVEKATAKTGQFQTGTGRPTSSVVRTIGAQ